jgi:hypothetical protein
MLILSYLIDLNSRSVTLDCSTLTITPPVEGVH